DFPNEAMYGCTHDKAMELVRAGRQDEFGTRVLEKFKALEEQCDFVLCSGTDFTGVSTALEFPVNIDIARNLGCPLLPVMNGEGSTIEDVADALRLLVGMVQAKAGDLFAVIVNRVTKDRLTEIAKGVRQERLGDVHVFVLPHHPLLDKPTIVEIVKALGARVLHGQSEELEREVVNYKVAAMELPHFLDHLEEGSLVITPGDRSDIILGSLLADASATYPYLSGVLLTGGLQPVPQVQRLLGGLRKSSLPMMSVDRDTFSAAMLVNSLNGRIGIESKRKIAAALGIFDSHVDLAYIRERMAVTRSTRITPVMFEYDLLRRAKEQRKHIVLPEGTEERILKAAEILLLRGVVDLTLLGGEKEVRDRIAELGLSLTGVNIVDPATSSLREGFGEHYYELRKHKGISKELAFDLMADVSYFGTMMVHHGHADGMVSGAVHTTQHTIRPALEIIRTRPGCSIVSSVFFMCLPDRVLVYGDCAVNPDPNAQQLADIAISAAITSRIFGIDPRIAMLSYSTGESGTGADVEKVREAVRIAKELRPELKLEGPIQYDAAIDPEVAKVKMPDSEVAGRATVFIFPDLNTGNNTYKAVQRSARAVAIGPVLQGLGKPVNDLSRGCTVTDVVNTIAITAVQAQVGMQCG
ncbi:MAG TPA: phosphate acetyltransferase, partial [Syntrophobacteraceae bacterium]|nr:phosphate acetyltransferase [Syntrophobacteraceae bacterium]